jgi:hypothetical protein
MTGVRIDRWTGVAQVGMFTHIAGRAAIGLARAKHALEQCGSLV